MKRATKVVRFIFCKKQKVESRRRKKTSQQNAALNLHNLFERIKIGYDMRQLVGLKTK